MNHSKCLQCKQCGFILIASMLMLILLTLLGLSMSKSFELQELIAGNQREKTRAFEAAQSALNNAEWWLNQGNAGTGMNCSRISSTPVICTNALANPTALPWPAGVTYTPPNLSISTTGGIGSYYAAPMFYIQYLGASPNTGNAMYQITALGYGGNAKAIAVVQSIFEF